MVACDLKYSTKCEERDLLCESIIRNNLFIYLRIVNQSHCEVIFERCQFGHSHLLYDIILVLIRFFERVFE
jgi:hypothetical protein